jgi:acyl-CoA synthetase (NDP forming)/ribosomal protein S18 acetylase RimI-like enzyme
MTSTAVAAGEGYFARAFLHDGTIVEVRSVQATDRDELIELHASASDESIRRRFFALSREWAMRYAERVTRPDAPGSALVAVMRGRIVGLVSTEPLEPGAEEVALFVSESEHGLGIGTILLDHMAVAARSRGVDLFRAEVLTDNAPMLRVFRDAGFSISQRQDHGTVDVELDLLPTPEYQDHVDWRERQAETASLRPLWEPETVAVVGVSRHRGGVGREVVENVMAGGFAGRLIAVSRHALNLPGVEGVDSVERLPEHVDLAIVAVPTAELEQVVSQLGTRRVRVAVILTAGLAETGESGVAAQRRLGQIARQHGMRLIGPNCFGVISRLRATRLDATFGTQHPDAGSLAMGSQSGGVGIDLLERAAARHLGLASFVSLGNKVDVSGNDLLAAWTDDEAVEVGALYLESFGNPAKFVRLASTFSRTKPLLVVVGGRSAAGARAGGSHTAASATPAKALHAMVGACGLIPVGDATELVDTAALFVEQPRPLGRRLAVVGNAGGLGVIAADQASELGLDVTILDERARQALQMACGDVAGDGNPIDLGAAASAEGFESAVGALLAEASVDAVLVQVAATAVADVGALVHAVDKAAQADRRKPVALVITGARAAAATGGATRFSSAGAALRALAHAVDYAEWRSASDGQDLRVDPLSSVRGPRLGPPGWTEPLAASRIMEGHGIPTVRQVVADSPDQAEEAARGMGFPVVVKTAVPSVVHKIEDGLVRTGLVDGAQVAGAAAEVMERSPGPVLVQQQVQGPELALGIVRDDRLGPLVMVASGGTLLSLWSDQQFLLPPVSRRDAERALEKLRTWPLLNGYRGAPLVDLDALVDLVVHAGDLAVEQDDVVELDLNPVVVTTSGPRCVDVKLRLGP